VILLNSIIFKRISTIAVCVSVFLCSLVLNPIDVSAQQVRVTVDGVQVNFPDAQPIIVGDRTLVPMRGVFEQMGFLGDWNPVTYTSTLVRTGTTVSVRRGDAFFIVNGVQYFPEVSPQLLGGRFMIPLRAIAEATGAHVDWNDHTRTVIITTGRQVEPAPMPTVPPIAAPSISIASQTEQMVAGSAGSANFQVNTQRVPNGNYQVALRGSVPNGVTLQSTNINISNGRGTLRLNGSTATQPGTFVITVSMNMGGNIGWIDQDLTLVISPAQSNQTLSVGAQSGTLAHGMPGSVSYAVTSQNLANGNYNIALTAPVPQGISLGSSNLAINNNSGTLVLNTNGTTPVGTHTVNFSVTRGTGAQAVRINQSATFTVGTQAQGISLNLGIQSGTLTQGIPGSASYAVTSRNLANGNYSIALISPVPQGVSLGSGNLAISNNSGTLVLNTNSTTPAGAHAVNFSVTRGTGAQAVTVNRSVTLTVSTSAQNIALYVGIQNGTMTQGAASSVSYAITTQNLPNGSYSLALTAPIPQGISFASNNLSIHNNSGTIVVNSNGTTPAGNHTINFAVTVGTGAQAVTLNRQMTLTVAPSSAAVPTISAGTQTTPIVFGSNQQVIFTFNVQNAINGGHSVVNNSQVPGVTLTGDLVVNNNTGTLVLNVDTLAMAGANTFILNFEANMLNASGASAGWIPFTATLTVD